MVKGNLDLRSFEININIIETEVQLLKQEDKPLWYEPVRSGILSVINSIQDNTADPSVNSIDGVADYSGAGPKISDFVVDERGRRISD